MLITQKLVGLINALRRLWKMGCLQSLARIYRGLRISKAGHDHAEITSTISLKCRQRQLKTPVAGTTGSIFAREQYREPGALPFSRRKRAKATPTLKGRDAAAADSPASGIDERLPRPASRRTAPRALRKQFPAGLRPSKKRHGRRHGRPWSGSLDRLAATGRLFC
jgi:hypothetical protein